MYRYIYGYVIGVGMMLYMCAVASAANDRDQNGYFTGQEVQRELEVIREQCQRHDPSATFSCALLSHVEAYVRHNSIPEGSDPASGIVRRYVVSHNARGGYGRYSAWEQERSIAALFHTIMVYASAYMLHASQQDAEARNTAVQDMARAQQAYADSLARLARSVDRLAQRTALLELWRAQQEERRANGMALGAGYSVAYLADAYIPGASLHARLTRGWLQYAFSGGAHREQIRYAACDLGPVVRLTDWMRFAARGGVMLHYDGRDLSPDTRLIPIGTLSLAVTLFHGCEIFIEAVSVGNRRRTDEWHPDIMGVAGIGFRP